MANHPQAAKRNRQRIQRQARNRHQKATMRTYIKRVRMAIVASDKQTADENLKAAIPLIDRCARKGIIPRRRASRLVGRLTIAVEAITAA